MGNGMNKVLPGLYLGSFRDGKDSEQLRENEITHIVSIHDTAKEVVEDKTYLCIRVPDSPEENLSKYFSKCNDFIHQARMNGGNVLVHCLAGVSRSATIAAAYIMSVTTLTCKDALKVVRGARNIANPNYGFHSQLREYESYILTAERKRLKLKYPDFNQEEDEAECAKMISVYHSNPPGNVPVAGPSWRRRSSTSSSANASPVSSPVHHLRLKPRSASSSPKRGPLH
ncbi:dual specificity protein phosphatase 22-B [Trichonephila inaurata madagascariensis]|uniref:Dual specificity protein phosphatase 15 n=1 Tax=Trichonephila inaurata madagascariensis TaxID=2747483 RepID=A0A8X6WNN7_9ARAC|nr:dual specificity protein phosphatase 22-B [Trichonephila inaurata madagascariensis]